MADILTLDIGNTRLKIGVFSDHQLVRTYRIPLKNIGLEFDKLKHQNFNNVVISSVVSPELLEEIKQQWKSTVQVNTSSSLPFRNMYNTPETLGMDRLCNAMYGFTRSKTNTSVIIDIGTCIKFDVVDKTKGYLGGSISPGIHLRYKGMHHFTGNLPLLSEIERLDLIGKTTQGSMQSGVLNGIQAEIKGFMEQYSNKFEDLTFFVTGGDHQHFDLASKNDIFADENLTLKGLYEIYKYNA